MKLLITGIIFSCLLVSGFANSAEPDAPTIKQLADQKQAEEKVIKKLTDAPVSGPHDKFNRSTPRSSLLALADAIEQKDFERAANYLDFRNLPFSMGKQQDQTGRDSAELIRKLSIVAQRAMTIDIENLSDDPLGQKDDGLPAYRDRITTVKTKDGPVDILMQRVPRGDGVFIWKISNATVALIPKLNDEFGYGVIGEKLSQIFPSYIMGGLEVWQIVMLLALLLIGYVIAYVVTFILNKTLQINRRFKTQRLQKFIVGPFRFLLVIIFLRATFDMISPSLFARAIFEAKTLYVVALTWLLIGAVNLLIGRLIDRMEQNGNSNGSNTKRY